ncbi:HdeD family acid-resistance protein [Glaciibacter psychrotolerans]|uniref:Uncharacterized membrane protein HdeD (DUF308 family) n=1 Tax=Glaciibacter psychrotolerans TaxID=670054 RepID=A0A7Z0EE78_9MICO|nr:DUF308 domain-containing protein [Leifsonia psychrotolerans]NYJ19292.1 uncharacterized membrane protein HdeD (DUF308 family) [Leifsonia psychrotolerans]
MSNGITVFDLTIDSARLTKSEVMWIRIAIALSGILAIVLAVLMLTWPQKTVAIVAVLFGVYFLVTGIFRVARGIFAAGTSAGVRVLAILLGVLLIVAGIVTIRNPLNSLVVLAMIIGISWIIEGIAAIVETASDSSRWFGIVFGIISVLAGIVVLISPLESINVLVVIGGIFLLISGVIQLVQAFTFGRALKRLAGAS